MEVILEKTVAKLGLVGEIVKVKDGFARNFLLPKKLASIASEHNKRVVEKKFKAIREQELAEKVVAQKVAESIEGLVLVLQEKASSEGKLFGSVTAQSISDALKEKGFDIGKSMVSLNDHLKQVGTYTVSLKLHPLVYSSIKVEIQPEAQA